MAAFYAQRLHFTRKPSALHYGGRLFQQYIEDVAAKMEQNTLKYFRLNQGRLRAELY
jgi:dihydrofolate reductase